MAKNDPQVIINDEQAAIVDAVAALLLIVSGQIRANAPELAAFMLSKRENLLKGNIPDKDNSGSKQDDKCPEKPQNSNEGNTNIEESKNEKVEQK